MMFVNWPIMPTRWPIARTSHGYVATPIRGTTLINGNPLKERRELTNGDLLRTAGVTLEFRV